MMSPPEEPTLSEDIRQRKNKNMEDISMRTIVRNIALTLVAFALALILPNTASAACEGFAGVPEDVACYESVMYLAEHGITKGTEAHAFPRHSLSQYSNGLLCSAVPTDWKPRETPGLN